MKYELSLDWIIKLAPELRLCDIDRTNYQKLLNDYAYYHERQTTMDFHHHLKSCLLDAFDEGLLDNDPTRKVVVKGKPPRAKRQKFLSQFELQLLLKSLKLKDKLNPDWLLLLIAKTGLRFSEAIAITPEDFDFAKQTLNISKTWNYKENGGFLPTKNKSLIRKIPLDWLTISQFSGLIKDLPVDKPIFLLKEKIYNSTINDTLKRRCKIANVPIITIHGLRHTHASILLYAGVSIASVAKRLGHSSMNTTERIYLHIINELENKDIDVVMRSISSLN
nr:site-specific integrase [Mycoplasmopsis edwardii]